MYADDQTLLANFNASGALKTMLNRLAVYARSKHLTINTASLEVVRFNSKRSAEVPIAYVPVDASKCSDSFRYLGVTFH